MIGKLQEQLTSLETKQNGRGQFEAGNIIWNIILTRRRVSEYRNGEIMIDDNKTHGYYILNWDRTLHKL